MRILIPDSLRLGEDVARWDSNADARNLELATNDDPSYRALKNLVFSALDELHLPKGSAVFDAGCGLGFLSEDLARAGYNVTAIDPSGSSIDIALRRRAEDNDSLPVEFIRASLQDFALSSERGVADVVVANMTLHSVEDIQGFMYAAAHLLKPEGALIATIPNPRTYLQSRGDIDVTDIDLLVPQVLEIDFKIRNHEAHPAPIVFHHRPIRIYSVVADNAGIPLMESRVPEHVGPGRPRDIALLEFRLSARV